MGFADRRQLLVGEIARVRAQGVGVGVRGDQRRVAELGDVPEALFVEMRKVDQDLQPVAGANQLLAEIGQARPDVGRRRTAKRHAVPERVRPAPHRAERAQPGLMQHVEGLELRIDRLRAFDMQNGGQHAVIDAMADVLHRAADAHLPVRLAFDADQDRRHAPHGGLRGRKIERRRQGRAGRGIEDRRLVFAAPGRVPRRGDEDRKHSAGEAALPGHRQIELSFAFAVEESARRVGPFAFPQAQQRVVVSVEDRHRPG